MEHYKLLVTKGQVTVEISSHDKDWVENKEKQYLTHLDISKEDLFQSKSWSINPKPIEIKSEMPINEFYKTFIHLRKITARTEIATFFVYYLTKIKNQDSVSPAEVKNLFKDVQYPSWNNLNIYDILNKAKKKAYLNSIQNQWTLTITGEDFVLNSMSEKSE